MIQDYQPIPWDDSLIARRFERSPGLYDDVYMDLTFVEVMAREGIDAPAAQHAQAFAHAGYPLWHANQAARYNVLNGLLPPDSGHWTNSPHADDIDFQIEADFAGLMSPGLVNAGAAICDRVGHIMNYGDGWYGGVYVAAMYSLAFVSADVESVVVGGPEGPAAASRASPAASRTSSPATGPTRPTGRRPGSRSSASGPRTSAAPISCSIRGTSTPGSTGPTSSSACSTGTGISAGRSRSRRGAARTPTAIRPAPGASWGRCSATGPIPAVWRDPVKAIEDKPFPYTSMSLAKVYETGLAQALEMVRRTAGLVEGESVRLPGRRRSGRSGSRRASRAAIPSSGSGWA